MLYFENYPVTPVKKKSFPKVIFKTQSETPPKCSTILIRKYSRNIPLTLQQKYTKNMRTLFCSNHKDKHSISNHFNKRVTIFFAIIFRVFPYENHDELDVENDHFQFRPHATGDRIWNWRFYSL